MTHIYIVLGMFGFTTAIRPTPVAAFRTMVEAKEHCRKEQEKLLKLQGMQSAISSLMSAWEKNHPAPTENDYNDIDDYHSDVRAYNDTYIAAEETLLKDSGYHTLRDSIKGLGYNDDLDVASWEVSETTLAD